MKVEKIFDFLISQYKLNYKYQTFKNCYNGNWFVETFSYYNDTGCFTIYNLPQRGEWDIYVSKTFSNDLKTLCFKSLLYFNIDEELHSIKKEKKFWSNVNRILYAYSLVIKKQIEEKGEFFGIKV